ncbi:HNH endonuclease, partial [Escherichia coli]|nr:HNH endonuclease [Escherichia coli]
FDNGKVAKRDMGHNQHVRGLRPLEVDHKDRNKFNDLPSNIRWVDRQMNLQNRNTNKMRKNAQKVHNHSPKASHSTP